MKAYSTDYLLTKLKEKANELGRTPTKIEIDEDKTMPNSDTYFTRFGGITNAFIKLGLDANRVQNISLDMCIDLAKDFYKKNGRSPMVEEFNSLPNFPHSSYIRKELGITWNDFLTIAGLPLFDNGESWQKNRKAEEIVKDKLIEQGYKVEDLSLGNVNAPFSFIVDDEINVDVRYSSPIKDKKNSFWKFRVHLGNKKCKPDYCVCLGFDEEDEHKLTFLIPTSELGEKQEVVSVNVNRVDRSKYSEYLVDEITLK